MNRLQRMQKLWAWIMGAITLVIALFFPPFWGDFTRFGDFFWQLEGFFWQLLSLLHADTLFHVIQETLMVFFPPCALTACIIWLWSRQMHRDPTIVRGMLVTLEAIGLAVLATVVFEVVLFGTLTPSSYSGFAMGLGILMSIRAGVAFLTFLPCLLIAATVLATLQRKNQTTGDGMKSGL